MPAKPDDDLARKQAAIRRAMADFLTPEKMETMLEALYKRSLAGDLKAAKLLMEYRPSVVVRLVPPPYRTYGASNN